MNIIKQVTEATEHPRKVVKEVYEALSEATRGTLKSDRRMRLPGIGTLAVKYKPAKPKRRGMNPFTKQEQWFKAKPAQNKLKFRPAKELRQFVEKKIPVKPVAKKKRK